MNTAVVVAILGYPIPTVMADDFSNMMPAHSNTAHTRTINGAAIVKPVNRKIKRRISHAKKTAHVPATPSMRTSISKCALVEPVMVIPMMMGWVGMGSPDTQSPHDSN
jgi:hypothetical protein